jgi:hypothetical protein
MFDRVDKTGEAHTNDITVRKEPFKGDFERIRAAGNFAAQLIAIKPSTIIY